MQPETKFKLKVFDALKQLPKTWYAKIQQRAVRGTPDILVCINGMFVALELKKDSGSKTTKLQDYQLAKIRKAGGVAICTHPGNWDQTLELLTDMAYFDPRKDPPQAS